MTTDDKIRDEKLKCDINKEAEKILINIKSYRRRNCEEILSSNQRQIIEQAKFAYSPLGEAFEK